MGDLWRRAKMGRRVAGLNLPTDDEARRGARKMWVTPVEPCVHGNYARHIVTYISSALGDVPHGEWCDGKPEATDE